MRTYLTDLLNEPNLRKQGSPTRGTGLQPGRNLATSKACLGSAPVSPHPIHGRIGKRSSGSRKRARGAKKVGTAVIKQLSECLAQSHHSVSNAAYFVFVLPGHSACCG